MRRIGVLCSAMILSGCNATSPGSGDDAKIAILENRVSELESDKISREFLADMDKVAYLTPSEKAYAMVRADFGNVAVTLDNVVDYADGVRVTLRFGNTTSVAVSGLKAKLEWGEVDANGTAQNPRGKKDQTFVDELPAAAWRSYEVVLPHLSAKQLGFVRVQDVGSASISLRNVL